MNLTISEHLRAVEVLDPRSAGGLQVFGLRWELGGGLSYQTLEDALAAGTIAVTEVSEGGAVPFLKVKNSGHTPVFLMAGEQLVGAKQNRILNTSLLVPATTEMEVPVSCVEAGRWGYWSPRFGSAGTSSHAKLRKMLAEQTYDSYNRDGKPTSRQREVWGEVSRKLESMRSASPSAALQQAYEDHRTRLQELHTALGLPAGCTGAAFALGDHVVGVDLFDQPETLAKLWPKILRAYAIDSLEEPPNESAVSPDNVHEWLQSAADAEWQSFKSSGLGFDVRIKVQGVVGGSLIVDDKPVHAEMFAV